MTGEIPKAFDPIGIEKRWYPHWEESGYFRANASSSRPAYSIVLPPPNVTGSLHMGHALNITLQDILVRWKRMKGFNVLWLPGTDHAGIATQNVVERQLAEKGVRRTDLGRERFEQTVWEWKEQAQSSILGQMRRLGCSCDWSRERFTLDEGLSRAVREVFIQLYEQGLIYRGEYIVNWCPRCTTAISDLEVEHVSIQGRLWHIRYPVSGTSRYVVVATTRPETMLGDTAVAVHPEDERYRDLHGQSVRLPLMERTIPVICDPIVERDFGTGAVKVTPAHDPNDFEAGRRHSLPLVKVIGENGRMTAEAERYAGLDRYEARERVLEDLERHGFLEKDEPYAHSVGRCQRCETVIEPLVSNQWFVRVKPLADAAVRAVEEKRTLFIPAHYERVYFDWMRNIHDWCISRQLWWGHRIPAWHCRECSGVTVARTPPGQCGHCGSQAIEQDPDVLDTWFSSALWPFSTLGWPERTEDLRVFYPTTTLVTGFDIIFFWVARMMMMGLRFMNDVPFRTVYINGLVRDEHGRKMSKSRGNIIDPLEVIDEYGADAIRFTLSVMAVPGTDIPFSASRMAGYRAFCNKIWNAGRFLLLKLEEQAPADESEIDAWVKEKQLALEERWILGRLQEVVAGTDQDLERFFIHEASNELYHFFWHEFCDWYIEFSKASLTGDNEAARKRAGRVALYVLETSLRLLHPFIPFITEEIWQRLPHEGRTLMLAPFPEARPEWIDEEALREMQGLQELVTALRTARAENNIDPRRKLPARLACSAEARSFLESQRHHLENLAQLDSLEFGSALNGHGLQVQGVSGLAEFALLLDGALDVASERQRLARQVDRVAEEVDKHSRKLHNRAFMEKAPEHVVTAARQRYQEALERLRRLQKKLDALGRPAG